MLLLKQERDGQEIEEEEKRKQLLFKPELYLLPPSTNLYETPKNWLFKQPIRIILDDDDDGNNESENQYTYNHDNKSFNPDFISNNRVLREVLAWHFAHDRLVSVIIHRIGSTLILEHNLDSMPTFDNDGPSVSNTNHQASLVSGYDLLKKSQSSMQTSLEEQERLRTLATKEIQSKKRKKKNVENLRQAQLLSKLHYRTLELSTTTHQQPYHQQNGQVYQWEYEKNQLMIRSDTIIYSHKKGLTSLTLRDSKLGPYCRASIVRLFLDNLMAGVPNIALCWHEQGIVKSYEMFKTSEMLTNMMNKQDEPIEIGEIQKSATELLQFLKSNCTTEFSIHWLFKGAKDRVARLWRLDPINDDTMDSNFRDTVLFQLALLCLRSSSTVKNTPREQVLLEKSLELLDCAANMTTSMNNQNHHRNPLRSALRERIADVIMLTKQNSFINLKLSFEHVIIALDLLLNEQKGESDSNNNRSNMFIQAKNRLLERGLYIAMSLNNFLQGDNDVDEVRLQEGIQCIELAINNAQKYHENQNDGFFRYYLTETVVILCELLMKRAKFIVNRYNNHLQAEEILKKVVMEESTCLTLDKKNEEEENIFKRLEFVRGNAFNELGKLLLNRGALTDARNCFENGIHCFLKLEDDENIFMLRLNIIHTYRIGFMHSKHHNDKQFYHLAMAQFDLIQNRNMNNKQQQPQHQKRNLIIKTEIFKTHLLFGVELVGISFNERIEILQKCLEYANQDSNEISIVHFHLAQTRWKQQQVDEDSSSSFLRLARKHFERCIETCKTDQNLLGLAKLNLVELKINSFKENPDKVLKEFFTNFFIERKLETERCQKKFEQVMEETLKKCSNKQVYQVFQEIKNSTQSMNEICERLRQVFLE